MINISQKVYLVKAIYTWCIDHGCTPYVTIFVDHHVRVPMKYVKENTITLNLSEEAVSKISFANECLQCIAVFDGRKSNIYVPMRNILSLFAKENGEGVFFNSGLNESHDFVSKDCDENKMNHQINLKKQSEYNEDLMFKKNTDSLKNHLKLIK